MSKDDIRRHFPLLSHLERQGVKVRGQGKQRTANRCPLKQHGNDHWCVSINVEEELFNCHSCECKGSVVEWMALEQGRSAEDVFKELTASVNGNGNGKPRNNGHESGKPQIVKTYDYKDQHDELVYQVVRYEPKSFRQRRPDPVDGSWHWNMDGVTRIPYHLPDVLQADTVVVCYDPETEILTPNGWVPIWTKPNLVAQANDHLGISFTTPIEWIEREFNGDMVSVSGKTLNFRVTPEHRFLVKTDRNQPVKLREARQLRSHLLYPRCGIRATPSEYSPLSLQQVRVLVAFQADGLISNQHRIKQHGDPLQWQHPAFNLKKDRKKQRLREILSAAEIEWDEQNFDSCPAWTLFSLNRSKTRWLLDWLDDDAFQWRLLDLPLSHREAFLHELKYWDGDSLGGSSRFFTSSEQAADVVQAVAATTGWYSAKRSSRREYRPQCRTEYVVQLIPGRNWRIETSRPEPSFYSGRVYCCRVLGGFLVTRRDGKVLICGNCEGEKDADNLEDLGYVTTTSVGGANNWLASYGEYFRGKSVILVPDNDEAGKEYAKDVIASLEDKVLSVKEAHVPEPHKDASDWIETFSDPIAARLAFDELFDRAPMAVKPPPLYTLEELAKRYSLMVNNSETRTFNLGKFLPSLGGNVRSLMPGDLVAVMAGTAVGKTALMQGMAKAADPLATLFFELELPEELMFERFVQMERGWYAYEVEAAFRADPEWYLCQHLSHILVCPESGLSTEQIEKYIRRSELKLGTPPTVVFVDYVGLVQSGVSRSRYEAVSYAAEQLKVIAKKTETIIIMGTQIHRPTKDGSSLEVDLHDAKDSGSIENSAGLVIGAWRPDQDHITLRILKNTKGSSGQDINCGFDGAKMQIWEESKISQEDLPQQPSCEPSQAELPVET